MTSIGGFLAFNFCNLVFILDNLVSNPYNLFHFSRFCHYLWFTRPSSLTLTKHNYSRITHSVEHPHTCMRSHVPLEQRGSVEGFGTHTAGQQCSFPWSRPRRGHSRFWKIALRAGCGAVARNWFSFVFGRWWRSRENPWEEGHREVQGRICNWTRWWL